MKTGMIVFAAGILFSVPAVAQYELDAAQAPAQQSVQDRMPEGAQVPAAKQLKQLEMMMQDSLQVMADIVKMQQKIVEEMKSSARRNLAPGLEDLSVRVNTLVAGMRGIVSPDTTGHGGAGGAGPAAPEARDPLTSAPRIQEQTEAGVRAGVSLESSNQVLVFRIVLDSETEKLDQYRFNEVTSLRTVGGREFPPRIRSEQGTATHRSAILEFENPGTEKFAVVLRNIAGVPERIFPFPF